MSQFETAEWIWDDWLKCYIDNAVGWFLLEQLVFTKEVVNTGQFRCWGISVYFVLPPTYPTRKAITQVDLTDLSSDVNILANKT